MDLSIVIVSWNVKELLNKCLTTISKNSAGLSWEIVLVDNASSDGTVETVRQKFPEVKLIANKQNLGFAKANNLALKEAQGEFILLLNPDTEVLSGSLEKCLAIIKDNPRIGILGCQLLNSDKSVQPSVRRFPRLWPILLLFLKLPKFFSFKSVNRYLAKDFDYQKEQTVDQVMGAFMLLPKRVIGEIGPLDERFFIWFEEVDFCRRARQKGYQVFYTPQAQIIHHGGQSFSQQGVINKQWQFFKSAWLYFKKYGFKN
ncbi:MAG: glycosyltransferase family 2 protein [Patescibacteria group bacterium]